MLHNTISIVEVELNLLIFNINYNSQSWFQPLLTDIHLEGVNPS
jgi:hypothetical protein